MYYCDFEAVPWKLKRSVHFISSLGWVNLCTQWVVLSIQASDELVHARVI